MGAPTMECRRAMTVAFLDEVMPINGPLLLIPKNHSVFRRRSWIAHRDFTPIKPTDDALLAYVRANRVAAE